MPLGDITEGDDKGARSDNRKSRVVPEKANHSVSGDVFKKPKKANLKKVDARMPIGGAVRVSFPLNARKKAPPAAFAAGRTKLLNP